MHSRVAALLIVALALIVGALPAAADSGQYQAPRKYYLALGDSLAYGFEQAKFPAPATSFNTGYVDDFAASIHTLRPDVQVTNYGCPGETTSSYLSTCLWHAAAGLPLHDTYTTSQEAAALAFLRAHPGQVSPITIDLGGNDALNLIHGCGFNSTCIGGGLPTVLQTVTTNMTTILAELRAAAPRSEIIVMEYYNPLYVVPLVGPGTDTLVGELNNAIGAAAIPSGARIAKTFPVINGNPTFPSEFAAVCGLTGMCFPAPGNDIHANDAGYALIADQFWAASGYGELN